MLCLRVQLCNSSISLGNMDLYTVKEVSKGHHSPYLFTATKAKEEREKGVDRYFWNVHRLIYCIMKILI